MELSPQNLLSNYNILMIEFKGAVALTEKELKQLYYINRETEELQRELRELDLELENFDGYKSTDYKEGSRGTSKFDTYSKLDEMMDSKRILRQEIDVNLQKIQRERHRILRYISKIEPSETRLIFRLRHINGMTWEQIGMEMHLDRRTVSRKYYKFLKVAHNAR